MGSLGWFDEIDSISRGKLIGPATATEAGDNCGWRRDRGEKRFESAPNVYGGTSTVRSWLQNLWLRRRSRNPVSLMSRQALIGVISCISLAVAAPPALAADCNTNGFDDTLEIQTGLLADTNADGIPDVCQPAVVTPRRGDMN